MTPTDKIKILLVDDHVVVRQGFGKLLHDELAIEVLAEVADGRQAVTTARKLKPDIVILDIRLPELNGIETSRQLLNDNPDMKIIVLTVHDEQEYVRAMFDIGAVGYVLKSCPFSSLRKAVFSAINGKPYVCEEVSAVFNTTLTRNGKTTAEIMALSAREKEVLQLIAEGYTSLEISQKLYVSKKTVDNHRARIMEKTSIKTISGLTKFAIQEGLSDLKFINKTLK